MEIFAVIVVVVFLAFSGVAMFFMIKNIRKLQGGKEMHFSGGVDLDRGYVSYDKNFFKGQGADTGETRLIDRGAYGSRDIIRLYNRGTGATFEVDVSAGAVLGRASGQGITAIPGDNMISKTHLRLFRYSGVLYAEDLQSANHTYVNGAMISAPTALRVGDMIHIGNTDLQLTEVR